MYTIFERRLPMEKTVIIGIVGIIVTVLLGLYVHWRTNRTLLAVFWLVSSLPGGDVAARIYEDIRKSKEVRGVPYQTKDGKWAVAWKIPPYREKPPNP
jgi:hypothetical protein